MKKDAELNATADAAKKEAVEAKNIAEQLIYTSEKALKEAGEKVPADLRKSIEDKVADLKRVKDSATPDMAAIKTATPLCLMRSRKLGSICRTITKHQTPIIKQVLKILAAKWRHG